MPQDDGRLDATLATTVTAAVVAPSALLRPAEKAAFCRAANVDAKVFVGRTRPLCQYSGHAK